MIKIRIAHRKIRFCYGFIDFCLDKNFHGVVVRLYEQSIEAWVGLMFFLFRPFKKNWQSLSLDYQPLMLSLLNYHMFIEVLWYLPDNKWLES